MAGKVQTAAGPSGQMRRPAGSGERMEQQMPKKKKRRPYWLKMNSSGRICFEQFLMICVRR